jgi:putative ATPase
MASLFADDDRVDLGTPLAERMRPRSLDEVVGQAHLVGPGRPLGQVLERGLIHSLIFWGPPGTGKTTIARLMAKLAGVEFVALSAVTTGVKEIRDLIGAAERRRHGNGRRTILFVDEVHRFNKAQQDGFLPHVESGTVVLVGATTENPSFEVNSALLSRTKVYILHPLTTEDIVTLLARALDDPTRGLGRSNVSADPAALTALATFANGDARAALNLLEQTVSTIASGERGSRRLDLETLSGLIERRALVYDKSGEEHFNIISALHKSIRNSDADAGLYWLARMLEAGEDPMYVARRLVRFASEDVGNADPQALLVAVAARDAAHTLGMPECNTALAQCVAYLAAAPKSNAVYTAYKAAAADALHDVASPVPLHLRNAPTSLMKQLDYGKGYRYAHDERDGVARMTCLPEHLAGRHYYAPTDRGAEADIKARLEGARAVRERQRSPVEVQIRDRD